jgi:hypothetical protein
MKEKTIIRSLIALILACMPVLFVSCEKQDQSKAQSAAPETTVEIPKVDLHSAVFLDDLDMIQQHIASGSDLNVLEPSRASTPLISAAALGKIKAAQTLITAGADLNYQNADGSNALHTAIVFGNTEIADLLIDAGTELNTQNKEGATPLHVAAFFGREPIVKTLLEKGADKTIKNKMGQTPLETVEGPFEAVKDIYDLILADLKPLGFTLDYDHLKTARPRIAAMLK